MGAGLCKCYMGGTVNDQPSPVTSCKVGTMRMPPDFTTTCDGLKLITYCVKAICPKQLATWQWACVEESKAVSDTKKCSVRCSGATPVAPLSCRLVTSLALLAAA